MGVEDGSEQSLHDLGDSIDLPTFDQILEMDDDEDEREFSREIVFGFFEQCAQTFEKMDKSIDAGDMRNLSEYGHFLKGSSATLGLTRMKNACEKIQHWGRCKDETGTNDMDSKECLRRIETEFKTLKEEYYRVQRGLRLFYGTH